MFSVECDRVASRGLVPIRCKRRRFQTSTGCSANTSTMRRPNDERHFGCNNPGGEMFVLIAQTRVNSDKIELYESTFKELQEKVKAREPFVLFYELCRNPKVPNGYVL